MTIPPIAVQELAPEGQYKRVKVPLQMGYTSHKQFTVSQFQ